VKKTIDINVTNNADTAAADFRELNKSVAGVDKQVENLNKSSQDGVFGFKSLAKSVKALGVAFKAAGIGLVVAALAALKAAFESNQETADKFNTVLETISIVFQQTVGVIIDAVNATSEATGGFKALGKVMGGIIDIALAPFKAAFYGIKLAVLEVQLIWEKSPFGSGDTEAIKKLNKSIDETKDNLIDVGKGVIQAGGEIIDNLGAAVNEVAMLTTETIKGVKDISIEAANEQAKTLVAARNAAQIAVAEQSRLVEVYDRQAEQQRQIRDEERNSIAERIEANEALREVLSNQEEAMLKQADLQVRAAQLELNRNKTTETRVALTEALANREGVLAQVEGLRSEQLANDLALEREQLELTNLQSESEATLSIERKKATNELLTDDRLKLQNKLDLLEEEKEIELARLQTVIDSAKEGTLAKLEAEIEYNTKKQELDIERLATEKELKDLDDEREKERQQRRLDFLKNTQEKSFEVISQFAQLRIDKFAALNQQVIDNEELTDKQKDKMLKENNKKAKKAFEVQKAASIAAALITTYQSAISAYQSQFVPLPDPSSPVRGGIAAGLAVATGLANVASIARQKFEGASISGSQSPSGEISGGEAQAPSFNVVGDSGVNQLATLQQQPTMAYVVSGEVTTAQALDRNRVQNATL